MRYLEFEQRISYYLKFKSVDFLRYSLALIFLWYGLLKVFEESPVNELVMHALGTENHLYVIWIGIWEAAIGALLFFKRSLRYGLILMFLHFPGTFLPLFMKPEACFTSIPFGLTLEGQYIFKNLILISAAFVLVGSLHQREKK
jgi:uncharacterized membrane protein YkgB